MLANKVLKLRDCTRDDCQLLFDWANEPAVRENSFDSHTISWEEHIQWFKRKFNAPDTTQIFIAEDEKGPVGQIRFDKEITTVNISFSVDVDHRGQGIGAFLLEDGINMILDIWTDIDEIRGSVKKTNKTSIEKFEKNGFQKSEEEDSYMYIKRV